VRPKTLRAVPFVVVLSCLLGWLAATAPAAQGVTIDWVTVGDPGNAADDTGYGPYGSVGYVYRISKYEVTNAQYAEFLNAVAATDTNDLYNTNMADSSPTIPDGFGGITRNGSSGSYTYTAITGRENMPVNYMSFWDALRFANWLHNGQPTGPQNSTTTEDGAYTLDGYTGFDGSWINRNAGATIFLTSEDEWYKAAYYDASTMSYNLYPFADGFDGAVCETPPGATSHSANCDFAAVGDLTDVGAYTNSPSEHDNFDQGGNVGEWKERMFTSARGMRGGSFFIGGGPDLLAASFDLARGPHEEYNHTGFRVAMIPEPTTALLLATGLAGLAAVRRRRL